MAPARMLRTASSAPAVRFGWGVLIFLFSNASRTGSGRTPVGLASFLAANWSTARSGLADPWRLRGQHAADHLRGHATEVPCRLRQVGAPGVRQRLETRDRLLGLLRKAVSHRRVEDLLLAPGGEGSPDASPLRRERGRRARRGRASAARLASDPARARRFPWFSRGRSPSGRSSPRTRSTRVAVASSRPQVQSLIRHFSSRKALKLASSLPASFTSGARWWPSVVKGSSSASE